MPIRCAELLLLLLLAVLAGASESTLLHASYDPTRAMLTEINAAFLAGKPGVTAVRQSHGGSGKQARSVIEGLQADVVSLALDLDVDQIALAGLLPRDWKTRQPGGVSPWTSTVVLLVRKGNPKRITGWADLARPEVIPLVASPKTSGAARLAYLAAWASQTGDAASVQAFMAGWLKRVPSFDAGARGATMSFTRRGIGDVLLTWENEAWLAAAESDGACEVVVPAVSILAEPPVAVVEANATRHGTLVQATAYIAFLATPAVQEIAAKHFYRPRDPAVLARLVAVFPTLRLLTVEQAFGGWAEAQKTHFADGALFDRLIGGG